MQNQIKRYQPPTTFVRSINSFTTLRRQFKAVQKCVDGEGVGMNSERLMRKRRARMLDGKLGNAARKAAMDNLPTEN